MINPDPIFHCDKLKTQCINEWQVCDGIANCPFAEDETYELCENRFSVLATIKCHKKDIFNLVITILAIKCDGIEECKDGIDEMNCSMDDSVLPAAITIATLFAFVIGCWLWKKTIKDLNKIEWDSLNLTEEYFERYHGTEDMKIQMLHCQASPEKENINKTYFAFEIKHHEGSVNGTICCIKVRTCIYFTAFVIIIKDSFLEYFGYFNSIQGTERITSCFIKTK